MAASSEAAAKASYWRIDSVVVINGRLMTGADAAAACLVQSLFLASKHGRISALELLIQLGGGVGEDTIVGRELTRVVQREVLLGLPAYAEYLEKGDRTERFHCIDLLSICASIDIACVDRVRFLLSKAAKLGPGENAIVQTVLEELNKD